MKTSLNRRIAILGIVSIVGIGLLTHTHHAEATFKSSFADITTFANTEKIKVPGSASELVITVLNIILTCMAIIALAALLYAAFLMITHMGEEDSIKKAKNIIKYVLLGLILIGISAVVVNTVLNEIVNKP